MPPVPGEGADEQPEVTNEAQSQASAATERSRSAPPAGIVPRNIHFMARVSELINVIERYSNARRVVDPKWFEELRSLVEQLELPV